MNRYLRKISKTTLKTVIGFAICITCHPTFANGFGWPNSMQAAVSISYDDGYIDNLDKAIPALEQHGYRGTFYLTKNIVVQQDQNAPTRDLLNEWQQAFLRGHETGSHGVTHDCPVLGSEYLDSEVFDSVIGVDPIRSYGYPCGETKAYDTLGNLSDTYYPEYVSNHYFVGRTSNSMTNKPSELKQKRSLIESWASSSDLNNDNMIYIQDKLNNAAQNGSWVIFVFHSITNEPGAVHSVSEAFHNQVIQHLKSENKYWIAPVRDVANYISWFHQ